MKRERREWLLQLRLRGVYLASRDRRFWVPILRALLSSSATSPLSKTAAAPIPVPMHIEMTPNRQSLPRRFISCSSVATHRAPVDMWNDDYTLGKIMKTKDHWFTQMTWYTRYMQHSVRYSFLKMKKKYLLHPKDVQWPWHLHSHWSFLDQDPICSYSTHIGMQKPAEITAGKEDQSIRYYNE